VDIDLPERPLADIYELMRRLRRNDDDLPRLPFERLRANGKERAALLDNEDLFIRMLVQLRSPSRREINPNEGDVTIPVQIALELVVADAFANIIPVQDCLGHSRSPFHNAQVIQITAGKRTSGPSNCL